MKRFLHFTIFFLSVMMLASLGKLQATHTIGGEVTYECLGNNQYRFTIVFYRDCSSGVGLGTPTLRINSATCGQTVAASVTQVSGPIVVTPTNNRNSCSGGSVNACQEQFVYQSTVTLPPCPDWDIFASLACCRNPVDNIPGNPSQGVGAFLNNSAASAGPNAFCNSSPSFFGSSAHVLCQNTDYILDPGAIELDGDSLAYKLILPRDNFGTNIQYNPPNTVNNPIPSNPALSLDINTGQVALRPTGQGTYSFALEVEEWRAGVLVGKSAREYQVSVIPCPVVNNPPAFLAPRNIVGGIRFGNRIDVCPGAALSFDVPAIDLDLGDTLFLTDSIGVAWGTFTGGFTVGKADSATGTFSGTAPLTPGNYQLVLFVRDNGCPIFANSTYSININVKDGTTILGNAVRFACSNGSNPASLTAIGGSTFNWTVLSGDANSLNGLNTSAQSLSVNPTSSTVYSVATNFICAGGAPSVTVNVVNPPATAVSGEVAGANTLCGIQPVPISVVPSGGSGGPFTYSWFPSGSVGNSSDSATVATPTDTTDYIISVFDPASGCTARDTVRVNVSAPYLTMAPDVSSNTYCPGDAPIDLISNAAAGNCAAYSVRAIPHNPVAVNPTAPQNILLGLGTTVGPVDIGFDIDFFCTAHDSFWVSSGGWLSFTNPNGNPSTGAQLVPSPGFPNNLIAFVWDDYVVNPFGGQFMNYLITGTAPNRVGLLTMTGGFSVSGNNNQNFIQVKLFEGTSDIEVHVSRANPGGNATIGVEGPAGVQGVAAPARNRAPFTINAGQEEAWRFSYDQGDPWTVEWYEEPLPPGTLVGTGDVLQVTPTAPTTYCAIITDNSSNCKDTICIPTTVTAANLVTTGPAGPQLIGATPSLNTTYTGANVFSCNGYQVPSIPFAPSRLNAPTPLTMGDDDTQGPFNLGFTFDWYCNPVTQVWINSNGWMTFSDPQSNGIHPSPAGIPDPFTPDDFVSFVGSDLEPNANGGTGTIQYQTTGTAPNRKFVLDFIGVPYYASPNTVTVQVVVDEATGFIEIYSREIQADPFGRITQGLQLNGTTGLTAPGRNYFLPSSSILVDGIRFRPDTSNLEWQWTSDGGDGLLQDSTAANPITRPLTAANSLICFFGELDNGACTLFDTVCIQVGALPLNDFALTGTILNRQVRLNWLMPEGAEYNQFIIEYAPQGERFLPIGDMSVGTSKNFSFLHENPEDGLNRYRLRVIDADGTYTQSNVVEAFIGELEEHMVSVFPNPSNGEFILSYHIAEPARIDLQVTDLQGRTWYNKSVTREVAGSFTEALDLTDLGTGVYLYQLRINGKRLAGKIQIQR